MNDKTGKILVAGSAVLGAGLIAGIVTYTVPEPATEKVYLPGPTVTTTEYRAFNIPVPGPTVTKKVEVTKTVRPQIPEKVTRSNERKTPKTQAPRVPSGSARDAARSIFGSQFSCIDALITRESGWRVNATNPSSGAYGLPQALPGSKMASAGADWRTNPVTQLRWMKSYVDGRYGGACGAWNFWQSAHWY